MIKRPDICPLEAHVPNALHRTYTRSIIMLLKNVVVHGVFVIQFVVEVGSLERESEFAADALCTDQADVFPMSPDDLADNGKTQPGSFFVFTPGEICLVKALPDLVLILFGNTDTVVLDADEDFARLFLSSRSRSPSSCC